MASYILLFAMSPVDENKETERLYATACVLADSMHDAEDRAHKFLSEQPGYEIFILGGYPLVDMPPQCDKSLQLELYQCAHQNKNRIAVYYSSIVPNSDILDKNGLLKSKEDDSTGKQNFLHD